MENLHKTSMLLFLLLCRKYEITATTQRFEVFTEKLVNYLHCCHTYDWEPSIRGMVLFDKQIHAGIRRGYADADKL
ncbi:MAG: hypothetical protein RSD74_02015 [Angelakisella sp.]